MSYRISGLKKADRWVILYWNSAVLQEKDRQAAVQAGAAELVDRDKRDEEVDL